MAKDDQINFRPHYRKEGPTLPCEGEVGDIYVFSPLDEGELDKSVSGVASIWFCVKRAESDGRNAVWARVKFDGTVTCGMNPPLPPSLPVLKEG